MHIHQRRRRLPGCLLLATGLSLSSPVHAQDDTTAATRETAVEEIVLTGSKLRRDEFASIAPVQVIGGQESVRIGTVDVTQMIAASPFVFGTQLYGSSNSGSTTGAVV